MSKAKLINALRKVAVTLAEGGKGYCHWMFTTCNCGLVARELIGEWPTDETSRFQDWGHASRSAKRCSVTGEPLPAIFQRLTAAGVPVEEFGQLEDCSNPEVLARLGWQKIERDDPFDVAHYMMAWADILAAKEPKTETQDQAISQTVSVMANNVPQGKELQPC
jgi:hypothetical protein